MVSLMRQITLCNVGVILDISPCVWRSSRATDAPTTTRAHKLSNSLPTRYKPETHIRSNSEVIFVYELEHVQVRGIPLGTDLISKNMG